METTRNIVGVHTKKLQKGITLIALVITIIVLLILAGVSIATLTGDNGILTQADRAKTETKRQAAKEKVEMAVLASYDNSGKINYDKLKTNLNSIEGISEKLTDEVTESNLNSGLEIWVDGYKVTINSDGTVEAEGVYVAEKNTPKETAKPTKTTNHEAIEITYNWEELVKIAKILSNNSTVITHDTEEVVVIMNENTYTIRSRRHNDSRWKGGTNIRI